MLVLADMGSAESSARTTQRLAARGDDFLRDGRPRSYVGQRHPGGDDEPGNGAGGECDRGFGRLFRLAGSSSINRTHAMMSPG